MTDIISKMEKQRETGRKTAEAAPEVICIVEVTLNREIWFNVKKNSFCSSEQDAEDIDIVQIWKPTLNAWLRQDERSHRRARHSRNM